jgi:hypothetical protein
MAKQERLQLPIQMKGVAYNELNDEISTKSSVLGNYLFNLVDNFFLHV